MVTPVQPIMTLTQEQLAALRQFPKHPLVLAELGLSLPTSIIVLVGKDGIRLLVPPQVATTSKVSS